ncbi:DUF342 domain-containing protein [Alkalihalobacillus hemicellulosilyticus]|uniref:Flagellar Assembly Protein A N-terminal region domain-containing protein n=1 Tax=Halalkalibacter hemicellulosilyticusJCM 9152 TaxID=1236971 RepID=W4QB78_9BACI|nr:FapA family protein [Halalkalibacter hemicellulosilyticus]GAE29270.1 hypothetical protein JCM9152_617 [Halalkalibacter hemicellulosilyticusJCM 9152]
MVDVAEFYEVIVSKDKMNATIRQVEKRNEDDKVTAEDLKRLLYDHDVVYGIDESVLNLFVNTPIISQELVVAKGKAPKDGHNAYLKPISFSEKAKDIESYENIDMRDVVNIPTVEIGEKVGEKIQATLGEDGININNEQVPAKPGRDFKLAKGKNTKISEDELELYSLINGQISVDKYTVHVHPTYEIKGDLSMKTGNVDFVGNVIINGNVPAGYSVNAVGDIRVTGTVEAATLTSGGSIFIGSGVVGQHKSYLEAEKDIKTAFINEGTVKAGGIVEVTQTILHSQVTSGKMVICNRGRGLIVGGSISAIETIKAKEIGNDMHTQTDLFIGLTKDTIDEHKALEKEMSEINDSLKKLTQLLRTFLTKEKQNGTLEGRDKQTKLKVLRSYQENNEKKQKIQERYAELEDMIAKEGTGHVMAEKKMYGNVSVHFGKYKRTLRSNYSRPTVKMEDSEIKIITK